MPQQILGRKGEGAFSKRQGLAVTEVEWVSPALIKGILAKFAPYLGIL